MNFKPILALTIFSVASAFFAPTCIAQVPPPGGGTPPPTIKWEIVQPAAGAVFAVGGTSTKITVSGTCPVTSSDKAVKIDGPAIYPLIIGVIPAGNTSFNFTIPGDTEIWPCVCLPDLEHEYTLKLGYHIQEFGEGGILVHEDVLLPTTAPLGDVVRKFDVVNP